LKIYYDHAFPADWITGKINRQVIDLFVSQLPDWMDDTLVMDPGYGKLDTVLSYYPDFDAKHKIAICFNDTYALCLEKADAYLGEGQYNVISQANYQKFWYFGYTIETVMREYKNQEFPLDYEYLFLNYNRKPKLLRVQLIDKLIDNGLNDRGLYTMGVFDDGRKATNTTLMTIPENNNIIHANDAKFHGIPNDITSLGNITVWNKSFINLISETTHNELFLSEKTVKPLVGKRPFIIDGAIGSIRLLNDLGFKTFSNYWDEGYDSAEPSSRQDMIISILVELSKLSDNQIINMYADMKEILDYNHTYFFNEFRIQNSNALNDMAATYIKHYFGDTNEL